MKKLNILLMLLSFACYTLAQNETIKFQMPFYFEDAKGNRDTITWGYSIDLDNYDSLKVQFGEDRLNTPFDSIFEVRIGKSSDRSNLTPLGKKRIARVEDDGNDCDLFSSLFLVIQCKYPPIKMNYDAIRFKNANQCLRNTVLGKNSIIFTAEPTFYFAPQVYWYCLPSQNEISIDTNEKDNNGKSIFYNNLKYQVKGKGLISLTTLRLANFGEGPCEYIVSSKEVITPENDITIFPNPVSDRLTLVLRDDIINYRVNIFQADGKNVLSQSHLAGSLLDLDVSFLPEGMYILELISDKQSRICKKFVKLSD